VRFEVLEKGVSFELSIIVEINFKNLIIYQKTLVEKMLQH
jgi:hypothetical protein